MHPFSLFYTTRTHLMIERAKPDWVSEKRNDATFLFIMEKKINILPHIIRWNTETKATSGFLCFSLIITSGTSPCRLYTCSSASEPPHPSPAFKKDSYSSIISLHTHKRFCSNCVKCCLPTPLSLPFPLAIPASSLSHCGFPNRPPSLNIAITSYISSSPFPKQMN